MDDALRPGPTPARSVQTPSLKDAHVPPAPLAPALPRRCLLRQPGAWNDFVDRYLGLIYHVVHHTAHLRSVPLRPEDVEDVAAEIMLAIVANDYSALRQFRGLSSLSTYLTVISRRICIHQLNKRAGVPDAAAPLDGRKAAAIPE